MSRVKNSNVLEIIESRLIPDEGAKKARGEVFTPIPLISEMLFGLRRSVLKRMNGTLPDIDMLKNPSDYYELIWGLDRDGKIKEDEPKDRVGGIPLDKFKDPNTKWLDPANGIGNFPVVAFSMLDYQLMKHSEKFGGDSEIATAKRRKHIIENMLYMIEINKGNTNTARNIFNLILPGAKPNIICANTLTLSEENLRLLNFPTQFDVIMGNPPYNSGGVKSSGIGDSTYESIWPYFVRGSDSSDSQGKAKSFPGALHLLKPNGHLCFIHPDSWLQENDNANLNSVMLSKELSFLRMFTNFQSGDIFSGGGMVRTAYYVLKNKDTSRGHTNTITILDTNNFMEELEQPVKEEEEGGFTIYSSNNALIQKTFKKLPRISEGYIKSNGKLNGDISAGEYPNISSHTQKGITVCNTNKMFNDLETPKIIIKGSADLYYYDDYTDGKGKYGIYGNRGFYITDTVENLKRFSKFFQTNLVKIILKSTKHSQDFFDPKFIPDIRDYPKKLSDITDKKLCQYLGIDYDYVKDYQGLMSNNQKIVKEDHGCTLKVKKDKKLNPKKRETRKKRAKK
jgi:hypothetical protein